ncbi:MGDG synthase family glycosyltransferase [Streptomyces rubiginosohelvolus]|uniref:MGDG synthase family glycosyltransferase n=1 Tax=Streptomyces rubiginosohelvolus TaxID=67362 RepID=UPI00371EABEC
MREMVVMGRFLIISASMGAGHDAVAAELSARLRENGHHTACADILALMPAGAGRAMRAAYRGTLRHCPWAYEAVYSAFFRERGVPGTRASWIPDTDLLAAVLEPRLRRLIDRWRPDSVVSTFHQAAQVTGRLRASGGCPPSTVVVTDFAVHRQWLHAGNDLYLCPTETVAARVRTVTGRPAQACGPIVPAAFTATSQDRQSRWAQTLALHGPGRQVVLLSTGAWGTGSQLINTAKLLAGENYLPVLLCGRDRRLHSRAKKHPGVLAMGWVQDLPGLMSASGALVDNAAGQTAVQAIAAGLPVIGYHPIPGHGVEGVREMASAGITAHAASRSELLSALDRLICPGPTRTNRIAAARAIFISDAAELIAR